MGAHFRSLYSHLRLSDRFVISPVSHSFIRRQLLSMDPNKAIGLDSISSIFLRDGADKITQPIAHMVNLSIITKTVPASF